jgi:outer membrane immunogenic protein
MKRFALVLLATSAMSALAFQPASAADLPPRPAPVFKAPVVVPAPVYNWTGFYIGIHGGGAWADKKWEDTSTSCIPVGGYSLISGACGDQGSHKAKGALGGGQAGFNLQAGNFVFGIEGQWSWSSLKGSNSRSVNGVINFGGGNDGLSLLTGLSTRVRDLGTIAGRLGVVVGTSGAVLLFVKGGGGFADDKFTATTTGSCDNTGNCNSNPDFTATWTGKQFRWGWMAGGGAEVKLTQNVSVKAEYNFLDLGRRDVTLTGEICTPTCTSSSRTFSIDQNIHLFKVGLNYSFGGAAVGY